MSIIEKTSIFLVTTGSLSLFILVPDNPLFHLDDPSYWGVIGYSTVFLSVIILRLLGSQVLRYERLILTLFLAGMPLIYIANWLRYDTVSFWIIIELAGLAIYAGLAYLSFKRFVNILALGIVAHGLWDLWHINQSLYVPNWYAIACAIVDTAVGIYVYVRFKRIESGLTSVVG